MMRRTPMAPHQKSARLGARKSSAVPMPISAVSCKVFLGQKSATKSSESITAMLEAEILPPAQVDFEESYAWYAKHSRAAADNFTAAIDGAIEKLCSHPNIGIRLDDELFF